MKKFIISCFCFLLFLNISCNNYELEKDQNDIVGLWFFESSNGGSYPLSFTNKTYEKYYSNKTWFYFSGVDAICIIEGDKNCEICPDRVYSNPGRSNEYVSDTLNYWIKGDKLIRERRINILDRKSTIILDTLVVVKITDPLLSKYSLMRMKPWNQNAKSYYDGKIKIGGEVKYSKIFYTKDGCSTRSP